MTGFELRTSGIGSDRSTNWATTTALDTVIYWHINTKKLRWDVYPPGLLVNFSVKSA